MKRKVLKATALFLTVNLSAQILFPTAAYALTSGPTQPELQNFTPVETSEMVDLFSGNMNYNLPLLDVGGYPLNLSYNSGITTDQEASWVGLGWNVNAGEINRNMRGLPDDFNGDKVINQIHKKNDVTVGLGVGADIELIGFSIGENFGGKTRIGLGISLNNYTGPGLDFSLNPSISLLSKNAFSMNAGLGVKVSSEDGVTISPTVSGDARYMKDMGSDIKGGFLGVQIGAPYNSRAGLKGLTLDVGAGLLSESHQPDYNKIEGIGGSVTIGHFSSATYIPTANTDSKAFSSSFTGKFGGSFLGIFGNFTGTGHFSISSLSDDERHNDAYGYLYAQEGERSQSENILFDFNREKDGAYSESTPNIALAQHTYDTYSVSGQGIGGTYRPSRSDIGTVYDGETSILQGGLDIGGVDLGGGNIFQSGFNIRTDVVIGGSGRWTQNDLLAPQTGKQGVTDVLAFKYESNDKSPLYQPSYFKQIGDLSVESDPEFFKTIGNFDAVEVKMNQGSGDLSPVLVYQDEDVSKGIDLTQRSTTRKNRERRNQYTRFLTTDEAELFGLENTPRFYEPDSENAKGFDRSQHPGHHVSEISVLREDGMRYYYGIPAYNNSQQEVTFAVNKPNDNTVCQTGLISYSQQDASTANNQALDNYFQKTELPAYAHSYLLTAIVSADYVDKTGDGPSVDDLGTYTRFYYTRMYTDYQWRTPFSEANYNEGLKSNPMDDKASFVKGSKEIWYLRSIETRTHVAVLELEDREDGFGSKEVINGGNVSNEIDRDRPLKLLRKISLYAKPDRDNELKYPNDPTKKAFPIKVVHFEYDYSLCPGVANNLSLQSKDLGSGKLTLKKVYFTFGNSLRGKMSPYVFHYADNDHKAGEDMNFAYHLKAHDRWGNYKAPGNCNETAEFPYVEQRDSVLATQYAAAWSLTSIDLPSGGTIEITYESDDYAYVQNKRAMQMFRITGSGNQKTDNPVSNSFITGNNFFFFELNHPISTNDPVAAKKVLSDEYFNAADGTPIQFMYFKFLAQMGAGGNDYVPGYAEIESFDVVPLQPGDTEYRYGCVRMKASSNSLSPVTKSAIQFARINNPRLAYSNTGHMEDPPNEISVQSLADMFSRLGKGIQDAFEGVEDRMKGDDFGTHFVPNKSFIRLYHPTYKKMGGGLRVKKITSTDHWKEMTGEADYEDMVYGQEYSYTKTDERGILISSGVASYEPLLGGDENPFRQPDVYDVKRTWAPSDEYYQEQPYGESWFPGAHVGYSEVTIKNIKPEGFENKITKTATGKTVCQYYTAQDFPTLTRKTLLNPRIETPSGLTLGLIISAKSSMIASQGYVVELNDMHGKAKSTKVYPEDSDVPISEISYIYQTQQQPGQVTQLDNTVQVVDDAGNIKDALMGVDYEMVVDSRRSQTTATTVGASINVNSFLVGIIPIMLAAVYPENKISESTFKSVAVTKIIQRMGILKSVIARDLGSEVITENLLYNEDTGHVLLTRINDEFDDPLYNFSYPAYWAYKGMGAAYHNTDLLLQNVKLSEINNSDFLPGDELAITPNGPQAMPFKAWVTDIPGGSTGITVQRMDKTPVDGNTSYKQVKVLRSGRRNLQSLSMGSVTSTVDPRSGNKLILASYMGNGYTDLMNGILNTAITVYDSNWEISCNCDGNNFADTNPYVNGQKGNYRPAGNYVYMVDRKQSTANNNTNIRKDGTFETYTPFWTYNGVRWVDQHLVDKRWILKNQVTYYGSMGQELENRDALQRYSAALYGFRATLPTALSNNASMREIGFESFEDYEFADCAKDKFSFQKDANGNATSTSNSESHTGKFSLEIPANSEVKIVKPLKICPPKSKPPVIK